MTSTITNPGVKKVEITRVRGSANQVTSDALSVEEPLEVRLAFKEAGEPVIQQVAVTMRTPGDDGDLAAGFLFTEGIITGLADIEKITIEKCNAVIVQLREHVQVDPAIFARLSFVASSCGVCGKKTIAAVRVKRHYDCDCQLPVVSAATIHSLPQILRASQSDFEKTGGIHASCLFESSGKLLALKEDVGRHNALDKLIGSELLAGRLPLADKILMVSGRASFELVQKAAHAGIAFVAAVGAPSSLAVDLAEECGITLLGFVRNDRFNIYSRPHRLAP